MVERFVDIANRGLGLMPPEDDPVTRMFGVFCDPDMCRHGLDLPGREHRKGKLVGLKVETPSALELWLAKKNHPWKEMREIQEYFYESLEGEVWKYEADALRLFNLPPLDEVKRDAAGEDIGIPDREFEAPSRAQWRAYERIVKEWQKAILGTDRLLTSGKGLELGQFGKRFGGQGVSVEDDGDIVAWFERQVAAAEAKQDGFGAAAVMPIYQNFMLQAFSVGIKKTLEQIRQALRDYYREMGLSDREAEDKMREILRREVFPQLKNEYLRSIVKEGGNRIRTHMYGATLQQVRKVLVDMARRRKGILDVARYLHYNFGGHLWYWMRIARTETALAYMAAFNNQANVAKIKYARWSSLSSACWICAAFDGRVWKFGENPEIVTDTHPHCVLYNCKIMTIEGWKLIRDIKLNELVLTHKGKFRRVTKLHKHKKEKQKMVIITYRNDVYDNSKYNIFVNLAITDNHPILLNGKWTEAGKAKKGDNIRLLATRCKNCNKLIPYSRWQANRGLKSNYCSKSCSSIVRCREYGSPIKSKEAVAKMRKSLQDYYKNPDNIKKLKKAIRKFNEENPGFRKKIFDGWRENNPEKFDEKEKKRIISKREFHRKNPNHAKEAYIRFKTNNPKAYKEMLKRQYESRIKTFRDNPDIKKKQAESLRKFWRDNPDKHPNRKGIRVSGPQKQLYNLIRKHYEEAELEVPIKTNCGCRFGDIVLSDKRIVIEYDGEYWHQDKDKDLQRDLELQFSGWTVLHFNKDNWQTAPKQIERLLRNHDNEYEFVDIKIIDIKKEIRKNVILYNLSIDQDESYIAKGFVVHNCMCILVPFYLEPKDRPVQVRWDRASPYDQPYKAEEIAELRGRLDSLVYL